MCISLIYKVVTDLTTDLTIPKSNLFHFLCYTLAALNGEQFFWEIVLVTPNDSLDSNCRGGLIKTSGFFVGRADLKRKALIDRKRS